MIGLRGLRSSFRIKDGWPQMTALVAKKQTKISIYIHANNQLPLKVTTRANHLPCILVEMCLWVPAQRFSHFRQKRPDHKFHCIFFCNPDEW